ncbi:MAG: VWA domain-containing protein, partial [Thermoanaerobaculia bacterium]
VTESVDFAPAEDDGTAIGMGLAASLARLKAAKGKSRVVIVLTDGINNAGTVDPITAADLARSLGIRVHTIGVGTQGPVPLPLPDGRIVRAELPIDVDTLRDIAGRTGGEFFRATDSEALKEVFKRIDEMEKSRVEVRSYARYADLFAPLLLIGGMVLLVETVAGATRLRVIP